MIGKTISHYHVTGALGAGGAYRFRPEQRGPVRFIGFRVSTRFPFGLFSKALILEHPERSLIYPARDARRTRPLRSAPRERRGRRFRGLLSTRFPLSCATPDQ